MKRESWAISLAPQGKQWRPAPCELGVEFIGNCPAEFARVIRAYTVRWGEVVKEPGAKAHQTFQFKETRQ